MAQITSKELMYLDDLLNMESQEITKYTQAASSATDPQVKSLLTSIFRSASDPFQYPKSALERQRITLIIGRGELKMMTKLYFGIA